MSIRRFARSCLVAFAGAAGAEPFAAAPFAGALVAGFAVALAGAALAGAVLRAGAVRAGAFAPGFAGAVLVAGFAAGRFAGSGAGFAAGRFAGSGLTVAPTASAPVRGAEPWWSAWSFMTEVFWVEIVPSTPCSSRR